MKEEKIKNSIVNMLKARFPIIYINTYEESRVVKLIDEIFEDSSNKISKRDVFVWSQTSGATLNNNTNNNDRFKQAMTILEHIEKYDKPSVFILKDFHVFFSNSCKQFDYSIIRKLRDIVPVLTTSDNPRSIIITAPVLSLPVELQKDVVILDLDLPDVEEILSVMEKLINDNVGTDIRLNKDEKMKLCKAAVGLTFQEAENAFAKAMVIDGSLSIDVIDTILEEKSQIIKKTGILEYIKTDVKAKDIGGLENLKKWLKVRSKSWSEEAKKYNISPPKGVLITGVPGCGKSLVAKAISDMWTMPLLRLDMGSIFSSLLGSSEENMRKAIKTAEAISPSILWIDEIEKGFSGVGGSNDSGVSSRIFGTFLTWMQEKNTPVFVIATANNIKALPSEFLRKGRFDEIFFVDLPTKSERKEIFSVHLNKKLKNSVLENSLEINDELLDKFANITEGFVGAEIESIVSSVVFEAFNEDRMIREDDFYKIIKNSIPLSVTQAEQILSIRQWANVRAVAATKNEDRGEYIKENVSETTIQTNEQMNKSRGGRTVEF